MTIHPEGNINVCTKFQGNPSNSCWNISLKTTNHSLMVLLWKTKQVNKVSGINPLENINVCTKFHANPSNSYWDISASTKVVNRPSGQPTKWKFTYEIFQRHCFISRTKHKVGTASSGRNQELDFVCGLIQSPDSGWAHCRLINNCHMAHTLHKTFQRRSNCWKHRDGYHIGCTVYR